METKSHRYVVILAGGSGTRLWPLSRARKPKQLLPFYGTTTLLEKTIERMKPYAPLEQQMVVTTQMYAQDIADLVGDKIGTLMVEPVARNTGPAITLALLTIMQQDPDAVILFVPADHVIQDNEIFCAAIMNAYACAEQHDKIVLIGLKPTHPATHYGYIELEETPIQEDSTSAHVVKRFHEKPTVEVAEWYYHNETMLWNSGIICARATVLLEEIRTHSPQMLGQVKKDTLASSSIDYAVLEKSKNIAVIKGEFGWSDVGSLSAFIEEYTRENRLSRSIEVLRAAQNKAIAQKPVIFAGVCDMRVVETDDLILVVSSKELNRSAEISEYLAAHGFREYV